MGVDTLLSVVVTARSDSMGKNLIDYLVLVSDHSLGTVDSSVLLLDMDILPTGPAIVDFVPCSRPGFHLPDIASVGMRGMCYDSFACLVERLRESPRRGTIRRSSLLRPITSRYALALTSIVVICSRRRFLVPRLHALHAADQSRKRQ